MKICFSNSRNIKIADNFFSFPIIIKIEIRDYIFVIVIVIKSEILEIFNSSR